MKKNSKFKEICLVIVLIIMVAIIIFNVLSESRTSKVKKEVKKEKIATVLVKNKPKIFKELLKTNSQQEKTIDYLVKKNDDDSLVLVKLVQDNKCQKKDLAYLKRRIKTLKSKLKSCQQPSKKVLKVLKSKDKAGKVKKEDITDTTLSLSSIYYEGQEKIIYFCVNLGHNPSHYLPHMALLAKEKFGKTAQKNNQGGYNWVISELSPKITGEYGVTQTGVFFVSKELINRYLSKSDKGLVEIKTTTTGWQAEKMILQGDYYIFKK